MNRWFAAAVVVMMSAQPAFAHAVSAQAAVAQAPTSPARVDHAATYDPVRNMAVVFGGASATEGTDFPSTLWGWDGTTWKRLAEGGPPGRSLPSLAFDRARNRLVMHGGRTFGAGGMRVLTDTWEWDGATWSKRDSTGVPPLVHAQMTYDAQRGKVVLFGGAGPDDKMNTSLYEWDGTSWRRIPTSIGPVLGLNALIYLPSTRQLVANTFKPRDNGLVSELWVLNDRTWTALRSAPSFSPAAPLAVDPNTGQMMLFAGFEEPPQLQPLMYISTPSAWTTIPVDGVSRRKGTALVYDEKRSRFVLIGGEDDRGVSGDVWEWSGSGWTRR